jgi:1-acyl-sn-glycerol-3-phosphate acyltransferase
MTPAPRVDRVYPPIIQLTRATFATLRIDVSCSGIEHIPEVDGAVLAANHTGFLDFTFVGAAARERGRLVRFMCKAEVFKHPVAGPLMRGMHHIPVDRAAGSASFAESLRMLKSGELVGIFPEGTISRSFEPLEFRPGATALAAAAGVPVLPVAIWGSQQVLTKAGRKPLLAKVPVHVHIGAPMTFERREDHTAAIERVRTEITLMVHAMQESWTQIPQDPGSAWWWPQRLGGAAPTPSEATRIDHERRSAQAAKRDPASSGPSSDTAATDRPDTEGAGDSSSASGQ